MKGLRRAARGLWDPFGLAAFLGPLVLFWWTAYPHLAWVDSGELAAVAWRLGVPHPPGYPLYALVGYLATHLSPLPPIRTLNLLSGLLGALACLGLFSAARALGAGRWGSLLAAWGLAVSPAFWSQATTNEVYPLAYALGALALWASARGADLGGYLTGLSLLGHPMMGAVSLPGLLLRPGWARRLPWVLLGLTLVLYIPLRALHAPPLLSWGGAWTPERFWWHITAKQYRVWLLAGGLELGRSLLGLVGNLGPLVLLAPFGLRSLNRRELALLGAGFGTWLIYTSGYHIPDIQGYWVPGIMLLLLLAGLGATKLRALAPYLLTVPAAMAMWRFGLMNHSRDTFPRDVALAHLEAVGEGGVLLANWWDLVSPTLYLQFVEGRRTDVLVVDKELLRRSWYLEALAQDPRVREAAGDELGNLLGQVLRFERGKPYDPAEIQAAYIGFMRALLLRWPGPSHLSLAYIQGDERELLEGLNPKPEGLVLTVKGRAKLPRVSLASWRSAERAERDSVIARHLRRSLAGSITNLAPDEAEVAKAILGDLR